jgi:hypothetical protein
MQHSANFRAMRAWKWLGLLTVLSGMLSITACDAALDNHDLYDPYGWEALLTCQKYAVPGRRTYNAFFDIFAPFREPDRAARLSPEDFPGLDPELVQEFVEFASPVRVFGSDVHGGSMGGAEGFVWFLAAFKGAPDELMRTIEQRFGQRFQPSKTGRHLEMTGMNGWIWDHNTDPADSAGKQPDRRFILHLGAENADVFLFGCTETWPAPWNKK